MENYFYNHNNDLHRTPLPIFRDFNQFPHYHHRPDFQNNFHDFHNKFEDSDDIPTTTTKTNVIPNNLNPFNDFHHPLNDYHHPKRFDYSTRSNTRLIIYTSIFGLVCLIIIAIIIIKIILKRMAKKSDKSPVVVTSSTHMPANVGATYPVDGYQTSQPQYHHAGVAPYPMPQPAPVHTAVPYPTSNTGMPMPHSQYPQHQPPVGYPTPYPPAQNPQDVLPPSYDQVVSSTTIGPTPTPYNKQSPYNPHYTG